MGHHGERFCLVQSLSSRTCTGFWTLLVKGIRPRSPSTLNVIFCVFIIMGVNLFFVRIAPRIALQQGELLTIYVMLAIASSLAGHDVLRVLIPMIPYAFWYATPENDWADLFHRYIPDWMAVKERSFLTEYYRGETTLYQWENCPRMADNNFCLGRFSLCDGFP